MLYFDIGANIGKWSLSNIDCNKIIAVEPVPKTFDLLKDNCLGYDIVCVNYAVCNNNNEDIILYDAEVSTLSTLNLQWLTDSKSRFYNTAYKPISCPTIKLDDLIEKYGIPDLIKIDVEGGEYECIKSLTQKANDLCFEWASETNDITYKCIDYLQELGYNKFYIQFTDDYTFRPEYTDYQDTDIVKKLLQGTVPQKDWGMVWCK